MYPSKDMVQSWRLEWLMDGAIKDSREEFMTRKAIDWERARVAAQAQPTGKESAQDMPADKDFWPCSPSMSRKQLILHIGQMNFRLTALRNENEGLRKKNAASKAKPAPAQAAPINGIAATLAHDEGAYARCSYCLRYSIDGRSLGGRPFFCECGKSDGWSGSFVKPDARARYSGKPPAQAEQKARRIECRADKEGDCSWPECPQLRDGEPTASGRHCPLDVCKVCGAANCPGDENCEPDYSKPPCQRCGAMTLQESETRCRVAGGDDDHCHGCELWPHDEPAQRVEGEQQ